MLAVSSQGGEPRQSTYCVYPAIILKVTFTDYPQTSAGTLTSETYEEPGALFQS